MSDERIVINPPIMDAQQTCLYLGGISLRTLGNLMARGDIRPVPLGLRRRMFRKSDLDNFIKFGSRSGGNDE